MLDNVFYIHPKGKTVNRLIALTTLFGLFSAISLAYPAQRKFTVLLAVTPAYTDYNQEVESYLKRELRDLKDVTLVEKDGDFLISVVAAPLKHNGKVIGIALSYVLEDKRTEIIMHNVDIGGPEQLKHMCGRIIAMLDSTFLERYRRK